MPILLLDCCGDREDNLNDDNGEICDFANKENGKMSNFESFELVMLN